jgi:Na+-transporting methylmalonyl-CoA/oxaloacetate decarboxylase gamma subunit
MKYLSLLLVLVFGLALSASAQSKAVAYNKEKSERKIEKQTAVAAKDSSINKQQTADVKVVAPVQQGSIKDNLWNAFIITCKGMGGVLAFMFLFFLITKLLDRLFPKEIEKN